MTRSNIIDIPAELVHQTEDAYLFDVGDDKNVWIPKAMCEWDGEEISLPEPLAIEKGLV